MLQEKSFARGGRAKPLPHKELPRILSETLIPGRRLPVPVEVSHAVSGASLNPGSVEILVTGSPTTSPSSGPRTPNFSAGNVKIPVAVNVEPQQPQPLSQQQQQHPHASSPRLHLCG